MKKLCPREYAPLLEVLTRVGSFNTRQEFSLTSGVPTNVESSDPTSDSTSRRPNNCSDLAFGIPIRTVLDLWET